MRRIIAILVCAVLLAGCAENEHTVSTENVTVAEKTVQTVAETSAEVETTTQAETELQTETEITTETEFTTTAETKPEIEAEKFDTYREFLTELYARDGIVTFDMWDMDGDGIDELFLVNDYKGWSEVEVYTMTDEGILSMMTDDLGTFGYVELCGNYLLDDKTYQNERDNYICKTAVYSKSGNVLVKVAEWSAIEGIYTVNGEELTRKEYFEFVLEYGAMDWHYVRDTYSYSDGILSADIFSEDLHMISDELAEEIEYANIYERDTGHDYTEMSRLKNLKCCYLYAGSWYAGENVPVNAEELAFLKDLHSLEKLVVYVNGGSFDFDLVADMPELRCLSLDGFSDSLNGDKSLNLPALEYLSFTYCGEGFVIPDLSLLKNLSQLNLYAICDSSVFFDLSALENLEMLSIIHTNGITAFPDLSKLEKLRYVNIYGCENLTDFSALEKLKVSERFEYGYDDVEVYENAMPHFDILRENNPDCVMYIRGT